MKVAVLGAGFTGLTAALKLTQMGYQVTIFEKEPQVGGLAGGFKLKNWDWTLEKAYHHLFTNDHVALKLAKELNVPIVAKRPQTNILIKNDTRPLDSAFSLLSFPYLSPVDRLRTGLVTFYLKTTNNLHALEGKNALPWLRRFMGQKVTQLIWEPLFRGKFGDLKENIALTWFWARIKKRTPKLVYPEGGFQNFAEKIASEIEKQGGKILLQTTVEKISGGETCIINTNKGINTFDKIISTLPSPIFAKITDDLPKNYIQRITSIPHLSALNLILILKKPFLEKSYWLNITDTSFPFLVLAEHTNFMDKKNYGNDHILYIGNYLPPDHPYLKMSAQELLKIYDPFLKKINPNYTLDTRHYKLFSDPFAQPVVTPGYSKLIPEFKSPLQNVYLANMDMVYPWDRGTNYAIELGEKVANILNTLTLS